jgi:hypothetical protein
MVKVTTRPLPETGRGATSKLLHAGQIGLGGWKKQRQLAQ